jgi:hypothetical protein
VRTEGRRILRADTPRVADCPALRCDCLAVMAVLAKGAGAGGGGGGGAGAGILGDDMHIASLCRG